MAVTTRTIPTTSDAPEPAGVLLFPGADLEPTVPGTTTYEQLGWTATGGLVNQPVATGAIGGQQPVSGFEGNRVDQYVHRTEVIRPKVR